jgi:hypothetical protein
VGMCSQVICSGYWHQCQFSKCSYLVSLLHFGMAFGVKTLFFSNVSNICNVGYI